MREISRAKTSSFAFIIPVSAVIKCAGDTVAIADTQAIIRDTQRQFSENIRSEDDLRSRTFQTFVVKFLACLPILGFSNI